MKVVVTDCSRCGNIHEVVFVEFKKGVITCDDEPYTHWGLCPVLSEPIIMRMEVKPKYEIIESGGWLPDEDK